MTGCVWGLYFTSATSILNHYKEKSDLGHRRITNIHTQFGAKHVVPAGLVRRTVLHFGWKLSALCIYMCFFPWIWGLCTCAACVPCFSILNELSTALQSKFGLDFLTHHSLSYPATVRWKIRPSSMTRKNDKFSNTQRTWALLLGQAWKLGSHICCATDLCVAKKWCVLYARWAERFFPRNIWGHEWGGRGSPKKLGDTEHERGTLSRGEGVVYTPFWTLIFEARVFACWLVRIYSGTFLFRVTNTI